jgi:hypothetical protein
LVDVGIGTNNRAACWLSFLCESDVEPDFLIHSHPKTGVVVARLQKEASYQCNKP